MMLSCSFRIARSHFTQAFCVCVFSLFHFHSVLQESLLGAHGNASGSPVSEDDDDGGFRYMDTDLAMAMRLSQQDQQKYELDCQREQEMIEQALKLSLQEN